MLYIYLAYGMTFICLGLVVAVYPKRPDTLISRPQLPFLVAFGLLHGANEWIDLARFLEGDLTWLVIARSILLPTSLFCLVLFGARSLGSRSDRDVLWRWLPWALAATFAIVVGVSSETADTVDAASRHLFGLPGGLLAAMAFANERVRVASYGERPLRYWLWPTVAGFAAYAFFAGAIGQAHSASPANVINAERFHEWVGLPVETFRAAAAFLVTYGVVRLLEMFRLQHEVELTQHRDRLEERVRERTTDLQAALEELQTSMAEIRTLSGLLPICAWCKRIRDDEGYWEGLESYVASHTTAEFTHGICPDCVPKLMAGK